MNELNQKEMSKVTGGGWGVFAGIVAGVIFLAGLIEGYINPQKCNNK